MFLEALDFEESLDLSVDVVLLASFSVGIVLTLTVLGGLCALACVVLWVGLGFEVSLWESVGLGLVASTLMEWDDLADLASGNCCGSVADLTS